MNTELMDRFLRRLKKENSYVNYKVALNDFYKYIIEEKKLQFENDEGLVKEVTAKDFENYFYSMEDKYKKSTINFKIEVAKEFLNFCVRSNVDMRNPTQTVEMFSNEEVKDDIKEKYIPTKQEILRMIESTYEKKINGRNQDYINARDRFYIALLTVTGLRANECLGIEMEDIEAVDGGYMINIGKNKVKNNIDKRVPIPASIIKYFEEYKIQRMIANEKFNSDLLFFSSRGKKLMPCNMNDTLLEICERASIKSTITNHCFRHFLTQYLDEKDVSESNIRKILGWKSNGTARSNYTRKLYDKKDDQIKLKLCDVFR